MDEINCPNCGSKHFVRKGKSKDKQFQRLRCKMCNRNWSIESFKVNKQIELPKISLAIVEHPDGTFSVNKIQISEIANRKTIKNLEFITGKMPSYQKVVELASSLSTPVHPNTVKLDEYVPTTMRQQLRLLFPAEITKILNDLMENLCKGGAISWK